MSKQTKAEIAARYADKNKTNNPTADAQNAGISPREPSAEDLDATVKEQSIGVRICEYCDAKAEFLGDNPDPLIVHEDDCPNKPAFVKEAAAQSMSAFNPEIHAVHADTGMPKTDARGQFIQKQHDYVQPQATETSEKVIDTINPGADGTGLRLRAAEHRVVPFAESHPYADHQIHEEGKAPTYHKPTEGSKV